MVRRLMKELIKSKRFAEAEIWQRKILHTLELSKGWDSLSTTHAAESLSSTLQVLQKLKESEELLERSLATKKKVLPEDHVLLAVTLVQLARLSVQKIGIDLKNANSDVATYYLVRAQQHSNDSIRIAEAILSTDQNKLKSKSATDGEKLAAAAVLLEALDVVGLTDVMAKHVLAPGLVLLVRLPLEHLKHGFFKIDAVHTLDTPRPFIWPRTKLIYVRYTTLRFHFKNKFGKVQVCRSIEDVLRRCISLYREPDTRRFVTKELKLSYLRSLKGLIKTSHLTHQTTELQDLLGEAQQIIEELGGESNRKL